MSTDDRRRGGSADRPAMFFRGPDDFRSWLEEHHATETELWMGFNKKHVVDRGLTWEQAVREALCFGWIDSVVQRIDDDAVRQRWTPRRKGSIWSSVNIAIVEELTAQGDMREAGLAAFAARRADRSAVYAYEQEARDLPADAAELLASDPAATAFWSAATLSYRRLATHWVLSAKQPVTVQRRLDQLISDSAAGRLIPSQRYGVTPTWLAKAAQAAREAASDSPP